MAAVRRRKREMVEREFAFHLEKYRTTGVELIQGPGRFVAPKTIEVRLNDGGTRVVAWRSGVSRCRDERRISAHSGLGGRRAAHPHRGSRARLRAVSSSCPRRRLRRSRIDRKRVV